MTSYASTFSHERRRLGLKTTSSPKNPDFDDRTGNPETVRRRSAFLTFENHFYSLESEQPQHGPPERITSRDSDRHVRGGIDKDKMICHVNVRFALNRSECFRAFDGDWREYRMSGENGDHARLDVKMNIPLNSRLLSKRGITNGLDF